MLDEIKTYRQKALPSPQFQKEYDCNAKLITLLEVEKDIVIKSDVFDCLNDRRSVRKYFDESINIEQLSYLLWATQGIQKVTNNNTSTLRDSARKTWILYVKTYITKTPIYSKNSFEYIGVLITLKYILNIFLKNEKGRI